MKKSFLFWLCFGVAIILATYFSTRIAMTFMGKGASARITSISISGSSDKEELSGIATAIGITPGTKTYSTKLADINARILKIPDVKAASVRRLGNGNLAIKVQMQQPVASWTDGQNYYPVSADGTIVNRPSDVRPENTIVFRGALPKDISEIVNTANNMVQNIDYLEWIEGRRWNVLTTGNISVLLPEERPSSALGTLLTLEQKHNILSKNITILDMRDSARILVK